MNGKHWSEDELLDRLYGVGPDDDHLRICAECDGRLQALAARRRVVVSNEESTVDPALLLRQRVAVMERIERPGSSLVSWRAATAFTCAIAIILIFAVYQPQRSKSVVTQRASSDAQFFSEIYSEMEQIEPRAAKPMRRLFEEHP